MCPTSFSVNFEVLMHLVLINRGVAVCATAHTRNVPGPCAVPSNAGLGSTSTGRSLSESSPFFCWAGSDPTRWRLHGTTPSHRSSRSSPSSHACRPVQRARGKAGRAQPTATSSRASPASLRASCSTSGSRFATARASARRCVIQWRLSPTPVCAKWRSTSQKTAADLRGKAVTVDRSCGKRAGPSACDPSRRSTALAVELAPSGAKRLREHERHEDGFETVAAACRQVNP